MRVRYGATLQRSRPRGLGSVILSSGSKFGPVGTLTNVFLLLSPDSAPALTAGRMAFIAAAAFVAGIMNAIAGGGTLLTFPALVAVGLPPLLANATSTVALVPGALTSMLGYRRELDGARRWAIMLTMPSLLGGGLGAWLLLHTPDATFGHVVPWLVLGATTLFVAQRPLLRWVRRHQTTMADDAAIFSSARGATTRLSDLRSRPAAEPQKNCRQRACCGGHEQGKAHLTRIGGHA